MAWWLYLDDRIKLNDPIFSARYQHASNVPTYACLSYLCTKLLLDFYLINLEDTSMCSLVTSRVENTLYRTSADQMASQNLDDLASDPDLCK